MRALFSSDQPFSEESNTEINSNRVAIHIFSQYFQLLINESTKQKQKIKKNTNSIIKSATTIKNKKLSNSNKKQKAKQQQQKANHQQQKQKQIISNKNKSKSSATKAKANHKQQKANHKQQKQKQIISDKSKSLATATKTKANHQQEKANHQQQKQKQIISNKSKSYATTTKVKQQKQKLCNKNLSFTCTKWRHFVKEWHFFSSLYSMSDYHRLLPPQELITDDQLEELGLPDDIQKAVQKALGDYRLLISITYRDQVFRLCSLLHDTGSDNDLIVSYDLIGQLFARPRTHGAIIDEFNKSLIAQKDPHRPFLITDEEVQKIKELIESSGNDYLSVDDISFYIMMNFNKCPSRSTVKRIIKERITGYKIVKVKGIDEDRYDAKYEDIQKFYKELEEEVKGIPVGFVFNLDESICRCKKYLCYSPGRKRCFNVSVK